MQEDGYYSSSRQVAGVLEPGWVVDFALVRITLLQLVVTALLLPRSALVLKTHHTRPSLVVGLQRR